MKLNIMYSEEKKNILKKVLLLNFNNEAFFITLGVNYIRLQNMK